MEADQVQARARYQRGQALHELQRRHHDVGGTVAVGTVQLQHELAGAIALEPFVGYSRAGDIGNTSGRATGPMPKVALTR